MKLTRVSARAGLAVVFGSLLLGPAVAASADSISISGDMANSTDHLGDFVGSLEYTFASEGLGALTVTLTNVSNVDNGGFLTGFIFNFGLDDGDDTDTAVLTSATHPFLTAAMQDGAPFGNPFLGGAALGGDWASGGDATQGIGVGETGVFTFDFNSAEAMDLTASDFLEGPFEFNFIARFRAFANGGSDKVPVIPAPASAGLLALGALGFGRRRQRR